MGIRDDIVGQRRRFVDKRIDGDKQRQTRRIFQSFLRHAAQPGDTVQGVGHAEIQAFSPYGYPASADVSSSVNCPATNGYQGALG